MKEHRMKSGSIEKLKYHDRFDYLRSVVYEKELRAKGAKFQVLKFTRGKSVPEHHHNVRCEVFYVAQGNGTVIVNGKKIKAKPGEFFLMEPGDIHAFANHGKEDFVLLMFRTNDPGEQDLLFEK